MSDKILVKVGALACCLLLAAGVGVGLYYGNSAVRSAVDKGVSSSSSKSSSSLVLSDDGLLAVKGDQGPKFAAAVGNTLSFIGTVSPADATNKKVVWSLSDYAKCSISSASTMSGETLIVTLKAVFSGFVDLTACPESNPSAKAVTRLYCSNEFASGYLQVTVDDGAGHSVVFDAPSRSALSTDVSSLVSSYPSATSVSSSGRFSGFKSCWFSTAVQSAGRMCLVGSGASVGLHWVFTGVDASRIPDKFAPYFVSGNTYSMTSSELNTDWGLNVGSASWSTLTDPNVFPSVSPLSESDIGMIAIGQLTQTVSATPRVSMDLTLLSSSKLLAVDYVDALFGGFVGYRLHLAEEPYVEASGITGLAATARI